MAAGPKVRKVAANDLIVQTVLIARIVANSHRSRQLRNPRRNLNRQLRNLRRSQRSSRLAEISKMTAKVIQQVQSLVPSQAESPALFSQATTAINETIAVTTDVMTDVMTDATTAVQVDVVHRCAGSLVTQKIAVVAPTQRFRLISVKLKSAHSMRVTASRIAAAQLAANNQI